MRLLIVFLGLFSVLQVVAEDRILLEGNFKPLVRSINVNGRAIIFENESGEHFVATENFSLTGGVVLDLKVCGELLPEQIACISIAEPRYKNQVWRLPPVFLSYQKIKIFDLDLIQDLAVAE